MTTQSLQPNDPENIQLFSKREKIYPKRISGIFRRLKWLALFFTLGIYYAAPFLRWNRGKGAPDQAILIDLPNRRAYWFFIEIWPQEIYIFTGILILAAVALFFVTSMFGRVWCGYFCPQTVWTDLFIWVERIVQGDRGARKKLTEGPLTFEKIYKKTITHFLWILIGISTAGAFVFYFNDAPDLWGKILTGNIPTTVAWFIIGLTLSTYIMAGFAREQVCTYMCPYARFQSAMFDRDTLIIGYDRERGEQRGHYKKGASFENRGHCIDCTACVQVCPVGIDIRDGLQMECIACGLCIDACDPVMEKLGLPKGLIRYDSEKGLAKEGKTHILRPRTFYYILILCIVSSIMLYALLNRSIYEIHVSHDRNPLSVKLSNGDIRNGYKVNILNKTPREAHFSLNVSGLPIASIEVSGAGENSPKDIVVPADSVEDYHIFVIAPEPDTDRTKITFSIIHEQTGKEVSHDSQFLK